MISIYLKKQIKSIDHLESLSEKQKKWVLNYWMVENDMFGLSVDENGEPLPNIIHDTIPLSSYHREWDLMIEEIKKTEL